MLPKKTVVKETPNNPVVKKLKPKKNEYLRECFQTILNRELLHMNVKKVNDILVNDVRINMKSLPYRLQCVLAECLCHYMKIWPGWVKYDQHCKTDKSKRDYFEKFRQYLIFKMNYIIKNENKFWNDPPPDLSKQQNMVSKEVQTDSTIKSQKPEAPYNLVISGQPNVLNNIVFIELDNNIVIKQHAEKPWKALSIPEFLNYSFVYAEVTLPDIHLSRSNLHEFQRYITECGDTATCPDIDFITYVRRSNRSVESKVYTFNYLSAYFAQFLEVIRQIPGINIVRVTELEEIFKEFLKDIQATNLHGQTMATATSVCYNIGGNKYIRNKKMVVNNQTKKDTNAINFCEILIPRTSYTLHEFTAEEDPSTEYTSFKSLNDILCLIRKGKQSDFYSLIETINNCVAYQCILCPKTYNGEHAYVEMLGHFRFLHKGEQSVLCFKCRKQFEVPKLSGDRWAHVCEPKSANATVTTGSSVVTSSVGATTNSITNVTAALNNNTIATPNISAVDSVIGSNVTETRIESAATNTTSTNISNLANNFIISVPVPTIANSVVNTIPNTSVINTEANSVMNIFNVGTVNPNISQNNTFVNVSTVNPNISQNNTFVNVNTVNPNIPQNNTFVTVANSIPILSNIFSDTFTSSNNFNGDSMVTSTSMIEPGASATNYIEPTNFTGTTSNNLFTNFNASPGVTSSVAPTLVYTSDPITLPPPGIESESATTININSIMDGIDF